MRRKLLAASLAFALAGCVAVPVDRWREAPTAPRPGDLVRVETRKGGRHSFRVYKVDDTAFYGVARNNKKYRVSYESLTRLELRTREYEWLEISAPLYLGAGVAAAR